MHPLLIRHALPLRSEHGEGSDPDLSEEGLAQIARLPDALARFPISRVVSSPQRRAIQSAEPVAAAHELPVEIDDRFAEYDRDLPHYIPIEQIRDENPQEWARMAEGRLPSTVDEDAFRAPGAGGGRRPGHRGRSGGHGRGVQPRRGDQHTAARDSGYGQAVVVSRRLRIADPAAVLPVRSGDRGDGQRGEHVWDLLPRNQQRW